MWKSIKGYEGSHEVNELGEVRSLDRIVTSVRNGKKIANRRKGKLLKLSECSNGYLLVKLSRTSKNFLVHRLVAEAFIPNEENKPQVNHIDGVKNNNHYTNLEWVTCSENHKHSYSKLNRKEHKLTKNVILRKDGVEHRFVGCNDAAEFLSVVAGSISSAVLKNHKCKGYEVYYETR